MSIPRTLTDTAVRPCRQTVLRSTSIPATNRKSAIASVVRASRAIGTGPAVGNNLILTRGSGLRQQRRPEQDAGQDFSQHHRLAQSLGDFAENAGRDQ